MKKHEDPTREQRKGQWFMMGEIMGGLGCPWGDWQGSSGEGKEVIADVIGRICKKKGLRTSDGQVDNRNNKQRKHRGEPRYTDFFLLTPFPWF